MRALNELPRTVAAGMHTVFSDIDDTLTTDGQLVPQAYVALDTLRRAGLRVILITGRPAGWCDHIARMWPVDAVIGENGAFYYWHDPVERKLQCRHLLGHGGPPDQYRAARGRARHHPARGAWLCRGV
jgi:hypothetical protein